MKTYQVETNVMTDFQDECFKQHLLNYCLMLMFTNSTMSNVHDFLSDNKNIVLNLRYLCNPRGSETVQKSFITVTENKLMWILEE